eukprot:6268176-Prymnesium_polylepis.1
MLARGIRRPDGWRASRRLAENPARYIAGEQYRSEAASTVPSSSAFAALQTGFAAGLAVPCSWGKCGVCVARSAQRAARALRISDSAQGPVTTTAGERHRTGCSVSETLDRTPPGPDDRSPTSRQPRVSALRARADRNAHAPGLIHVPTVGVVRAPWRLIQSGTGLIQSGTGLIQSGTGLIQRRHADPAAVDQSSPVVNPAR